MAIPKNYIAFVSTENIALAERELIKKSIDFKNLNAETVCYLRGIMDMADAAIEIIEEPNKGEFGGDD